MVSSCSKISQTGSLLWSMENVTRDVQKSLYVINCIYYICVYLLILEAKSYHCFVLLMKRMDHNFSHGENMDKHFANMRSLIQVIYELSMNLLTRELGMFNRIRRNKS